MWVFRRRKSGYVISLLLGLMGIVALWVTMQRVWSQISVASDPLSTFVELLWTEKFEFASYLEFSMLYLFILGCALLVVGVVVAILSTERLYSPGKIVWYHCPYCKNDWKASGYYGLTQCPICRQQVHPTILEKQVA